MTAKREAEDRLVDIVALAQAVIVKARAAQEAMATIEDAPPEREDEKE